MSDTEDLKDRLERIEHKIENLSDMVQHLHSKIDINQKTLDKHIKFIDDTYEGLRNPIKAASNFFRR